MPVSKPALVARINRKLAADDQRLKAVRSAKAQLTLGEYIVVDITSKFPVETHVDLADYARELGVLAPYERLDE